MKALLVILTIIAIGYLGLCVWLYFRQSSLVYYPKKELEATPVDYKMYYVDCQVTSADNSKLHGWHLFSDLAVTTGQPLGTIFFAHGNGGNISHRLDLISHWRSLGLNVFCFDYQGYGKSSGRPSEQGTYADIRACWEYLITQFNVPPEKIIVLGRSLGAAVASHLVAELTQEGKPTPAGLIMEAPFTSIPDMGARLYPFLPVRMLSRIVYDNQAQVARIHVPLLIMHGSDDELVPESMGKEVYESANEPKRFVSLPGGHEDTYIVGQVDYDAALMTFVHETITSKE